jgi:hypothetical protein
MKASTPSRVQPITSFTKHRFPSEPLNCVQEAARQNSIYPTMRTTILSIKPGETHPH